MQTITYRKLNKKQYPAVRQMINSAFGLYRYIHNPSVLDSCLNAYLQSCLTEATFTCVAQQDGIPIGIIMGKADKDYRISWHIKPWIALLYHLFCMQLKSLFTRCDIGDYKRMHQIYHELRTACSQRFDGVLTLFAVTENCRGLGVGKELLQRLFTYQKEHGVTSIYLYTDTSCNFGFYEHQGFQRLGEKETQVMSERNKKSLGVYLYGYKFD